MKWFVSAYLLLLGAGATFVVLFPGVVMIGIYLLVLPGLLLMALPPLFQWTAPPLLAWLVLHGRLGHLGAIVLGVVFMALAYGLPAMPARWAAQAHYADLTRPDVVPDRLVPEGDVRLDLPRPVWDQRPEARVGNVRPYACDAACVALLFQPGVTSVTVNKSTAVPLEAGELRPPVLDRSATTYRLLPAEVADPAAVAEPAWAHRAQVTGRYDQAYRERLAVDVRIVRAPRVERFDQRFVEADFDEGAAPGKRFAPVGRWSLARSAAYIRTVEATDGQGQVLARVRRVSVRAPLAPLVVGYGVLPHEQPHFGWFRQSWADDSAHDDLLDLGDALAAWTDLPDHDPSR